MNEVMINIKLDPRTDGIVLQKDAADRVDEHFIILGTNGMYREATFKETMQILDEMEDHSAGMMIGCGEHCYLLIFDGTKIFQHDDGEFFVGSMVVMKMTDKDRQMLKKEDVQEVKELLAGHMAMFQAGRDRFQALIVA